MTEERDERVAWLRAQLKEGFGVSFVGFAVAALLLGVLAYVLKGPDVFGESQAIGVDLLAQILPRLGAALLIAGCIRVLVSRDLIARTLGEESGLRGLFIATAAGALTPGGPVTAFSILAMLKTLGVDRGILVAFSTSWALLGFQRLLLWELPLLGLDFWLLRMASSWMLPIVAGLIARRVPIRIGGGA